MGEVITLGGRRRPTEAVAAELRRKANAVSTALLGAGFDEDASRWVRDPAVAAVLLARAMRDPELSFAIVLEGAGVGMPIHDGFGAIAENGVDAGLGDAEARLLRSLSRGGSAKSLDWNDWNDGFDGAA